MYFNTKVGYWKDPILSFKNQVEKSWNFKRWIRDRTKWNSNAYIGISNQQGWNYAHSHEGSTVANTKHHNMYKQLISFLNQIIIIYINKNI